MSDSPIDIWDAPADSSRLREVNEEKNAGVSICPAHLRIGEGGGGGVEGGGGVRETFLFFTFQRLVDFPKLILRWKIKMLIREMHLGS